MYTYCSKNAAKLLPFCFHIQINSTDYKSHYNRNLVTYCSRVNYFFDISPFPFFGAFMFIFFLILLLRFRIRSSPNFYLECYIHSSHIRGFLCQSRRLKGKSQTHLLVGNMHKPLCLILLVKYYLIFITIRKYHLKIDSNVIRILSVKIFRLPKCNEDQLKSIYFMPF